MLRSPRVFQRKTRSPTTVSQETVKGREAQVNGQLFRKRPAARQYFVRGGVAQLGERLPCTQEAIGSSPFTSTKKIFDFFMARVTKWPEPKFFVYREVIKYREIFDIKH